MTRLHTCQQNCKSSRIDYYSLFIYLEKGKKKKKAVSCDYADQNQQHLYIYSAMLLVTPTYRITFKGINS